MFPSILSVYWGSRFSFSKMYLYNIFCESASPASSYILPLTRMSLSEAIGSRGFRNCFLMAINRAITIVAKAPPKDPIRAFEVAITYDNGDISSAV